MRQQVQPLETLAQVGLVFGVVILGKNLDIRIITTQLTKSAKDAFQRRSARRHQRPLFSQERV